MGLERPGGPYAAEMTAGPAWPDVDETTLLNDADAFHADSTAVDKQLWVFQQARSRLFDDEAWLGQAADAAHAKHRKQIDRLQSHVQGSATASKLYRDCAAVVVHTKQQISDNVENTQKQIAQVANHPQATAEQKDYFIEGLVNATHRENVQLVEAGAARLGKPGVSNFKQGPTPTPSPSKCEDPTELLHDWADLQADINEHNANPPDPTDLAAVADYDAEYWRLTAKLTELSSKLLDCGVPTTITPAPPPTR